MAPCLPQNKNFFDDVHHSIINYELLVRRARLSALFRPGCPFRLLAPRPLLCPDHPFLQVVPVKKIQLDREQSPNNLRTFLTGMPGGPLDPGVPGCPAGP